MDKAPFHLLPLEHAVSMPRPGFPFTDDFAATAHDLTRTAAVLEDLRQGGDALEDADARLALGALLRDPSVLALLSAIFGNSPFLSRVALSDVAYLPRLFAASPETTLTELLAVLASALRDAVDMDGAMTHLRVARRRAPIFGGPGGVGGGWGF